MPYRLVAQGTVSDIGDLGQYEGHFTEGSQGYLEVNLESELAANVVGWLDSELEGLGVPGHKVTTEGTNVYISFRKEIAPLMLIAIAITGIIALIGLVIAWKLWKLSPGQVVLSALAVVAIIAAVVAVIAIFGGLAYKGLKLGKAR